MSRFFRGASSSESDAEESDEGQRAGVRPVGEVPRFMESSSESEEEKRVVRSAKDKRSDDLGTIVKQLNNHKKIKDFSTMQTDFEELVRIYDRGKKTDEGEVPKIFIKAIADLEKELNESWENKSSFNKASQANLGKIRQRVRKYNRDFDTQLNDYKENPSKYEGLEADHEEKEEEEKKSDAGSASGEEPEPPLKPVPAKSKASKEAAPTPKKPTEEGEVGGGEEEEEDEDEWPTESEEESSESEASDDEKYRENPSLRFLKKAADDESDEDRKNKEDRETRKREKERQRKERLKREAEEQDEAALVAQLPMPALRQEDISNQTQRFQYLKERLKLNVEKGTDLTNSMIFKKYIEIVSLRGKRGTDRLEQVQLLAELQQLIADYAEGAGTGGKLSTALRVKLIFSLVPSLYDFRLNVLAPMPAATWEKCLKYVTILLELLEKNLDIDVGIQIPEDHETFENAPYRVQGCILSLCERLSDEYNKFLHSLDPHSTEYVDRLRDETTLFSLLQRLVRYLETKMERAKAAPDQSKILHVVGPEELQRSYLKLMEHLYYKMDNKWARQWDELQKREREKRADTEPDYLKDTAFEACHGEAVDDVDQSHTATLQYQAFAQHFLERSEAYKEMHRLYSYIIRPDLKFELRPRLKAVLLFIYFLLIHDQYYKARDLFAMSQVGPQMETIVLNVMQLTEKDRQSGGTGTFSVSLLHDVQLQVLFNRVLVQMGLAAFRQGNIREAHTCLVDVQSSGRAKELLGQGSQMVRGQPQQELTQEQELFERLKQLPYLMHINLDLLEAIYLIAAIITEIPYMASHEFDQKRKLISKNLHHVLKLQDRQLISTQPPETVRDHLIAAARAIRVGDWNSSLKLIFAEKMNYKIWDLFTPYAFQRARLRELLVKRVKQECLRCFIFTYRYYYTSISLKTLEQQFSLSIRVINSLLARMILNDELNASLDQPTQTLMIHHSGPSESASATGDSIALAAGLDSGGSERQRLQALVLQFNEKLQTLFEANERINELRNQQTSVGGGGMRYGPGGVGAQQGQGGGQGRQGPGGAPHYHHPGGQHKRHPPRQ